MTCQGCWLLRVMSDRRCGNNAASCGTLVAQCGQQWRQAWHLLNEMERSKLRGNEVRRKPVGDFVFISFPPRGSFEDI